MSQGDKLITMVEEAKKDGQAADRLIEAYLPFIRAETAKFIHRHPQEGQDEELSVAMFAFYEAAMAYDASRGAFIALASRNIRHRLIDYSRKEARHRGLISLDDQGPGEDDQSLLDRIDDGTDRIGDRVENQALQMEIEAYRQDLALFGLTLSDVADRCPKQERTLKACQQVLAYAKTEPGLIRDLLQTKKLPVTALAKGSGVAKKTIERHRDYVIALLLAFSNGFEIIRGHLHAMTIEEKGGEA